MGRGDGSASERHLGLKGCASRREVPERGVQTPLQQHATQSSDLSAAPGTFVVVSTLQEVECVPGCRLGAALCSQGPQVTTEDVSMLVGVPVSRMGQRTLVKGSLPRPQDLRHGLTELGVAEAEEGSAMHVVVAQASRTAFGRGVVVRHGGLQEGFTEPDAHARCLRTLQAPDLRFLPDTDSGPMRSEPLECWPAGGGRTRLARGLRFGVVTLPFFDGPLSQATAASIL